MKTWHIHIEGIVQGVGFRPHVYNVARLHGISGTVSNTNDGVHIHFSASEPLTEVFKKAVIDNAPTRSKITNASLTEAEYKVFEDFKIIHESYGSGHQMHITPDFAMCETCREEIIDENNHRFQYGFTTCTTCGPRYSILNKLPYDREHTAMEEFVMCTDCQSEYGEVENSRYYSQSNSCAACGITLSLYKADECITQDQSKILELIPQLWESGKIVAIKGIGGYLLTCDANQAEVIQRLRKHKNRPTKPLAIMIPYEDRYLDDIAQAELDALQSSVSPIVLTPKADWEVAYDDIAHGLSLVGVMIPYTPLYHLLLGRFGKPIVATSGNISQSPIIYQDEEVLSSLGDIADYILMNDRLILTPQDDSVVRYSPQHKQKIILRRGRGMAPDYVGEKSTKTKKKYLSLGAMMKSTFSLMHKETQIISQYLGNLDTYQNVEAYKDCIEHLTNLMDFKPDVIVTDLHPQYPSTQLGSELAVRCNGELRQVQHHRAHFAAIIGEHDLIESQEPIMGVVWDGTGLGEDGHIWGGEFFLYADDEIKLSTHFEFFDHILNDKMAKEPRISALSLAGLTNERERLLKSKFSDTEWGVYQRLLTKNQPLQTSSVGRLFDAVASLLGIMDIQSYEGEAAMHLEELATSYVKIHPNNDVKSYLQKEEIVDHIPTKTIIQRLIKDIRRSEDRSLIAAAFHQTLAESIGYVAEKLDVSHIAFSGGVFQNGLLVDMIINTLKDKYKLYFHTELSPNDENISYGQYIYQIMEEKKSKKLTAKIDHICA